MSVRTSGSVDNDRDPESLYGDASVADRDYPILNSNVDDNQRTPSPGAEDDNQDPNYTPTRQPTASAASTVFTTPSQRSNLGEFSSVTRQALDKLYTLVYGENSRRCILTQVPTPLNAAHVVQRATKSHQVRCLLPLCNIYLTIAVVNALRILFRLRFPDFSRGQQAEPCISCVTSDLALIVLAYLACS